MTYRCNAYIAIAAVLAQTSPANAALKVGQKVTKVRLWDGNNKPTWLPDIGKKVIALFYTDPDVRNQNEHFRNDLKAADLDPKFRHSRGIGVVNMKDTWKPNFIIRSVVRKKTEEFKSLILTDKKRKLAKEWNLGSCNDEDIVILIDVNARVRYIKRGGSMTAKERKMGIRLYKALIEEAKSAR